MARTSERLEDLTVAELRKLGKRRQVSHVWEMKKADLVAALRRAGRAARGRSKEISSVEEREDSAGQTLVTRDHWVIRAWAEMRGAVPATVPGTEHGDRVGVLRLDFPGAGDDDLGHVTWDEWFATFDERNLCFVYQEHTTDGADSNFFRFDAPVREDA